jgi:cysteine desulfurase
MQTPLYFDYMATTPIDDKVITKMLGFMGKNTNFANPGSIQHQAGKTAALAIENARAQIAASLNTTNDAIIFTSGATESNNLALLGSARFYQRKGKHIITMATEHKTVLESFAALKHEGFEVTILNPQKDGLLDIDDLTRHLRNDTILVSVMHANNEIGVIQDISAIANLLDHKGIIFHVDAAQSAGKLHIDLSNTPIDLMSLSAHKNYGPKGVGALYIKQNPKLRLQHMSFGGGQERGLRSGTLATHQIVGMGEAFAISHEIMQQEQLGILELRNHLWQGIADLPQIRVNGHFKQRLAGNLNISLPGIKSDLLMQHLKNLAFSTMSTCNLTKSSSSYVLKALGVEPAVAQNTIRLSLGRFTTINEVNFAIQEFQGLRAYLG